MDEVRKELRKQQMQILELAATVLRLTKFVEELQEELYRLNPIEK